MAASERLGLRAITMQQPYAAAMAHGQGLYTRRGRSVSFGGEWIAVHCGGNSAHLNNAKLMAKVRNHWPGCPSDEELRAGQGCILGVAHFVDGSVSPTSDRGASSDFFLQAYDCSKPVAWRADEARVAETPLAYKKGQVQVWHLKHGGFAGGVRAEEAILRLVGRGAEGVAGHLKHSSSKKPRKGLTRRSPTIKREAQTGGGQGGTLSKKRRRGAAVEEAVSAAVPVNIKSEEEQ